jgi:beta-1,4-N-acetylglucosaminyltransferase
MSCFVTVGTTQFDELIRALDDAKEGAQALVDVLRKHGFSRLVVQKGRGEYVPTILPKICAPLKDFAFECFDFAPSLDAHIKGAKLVVSHAGAGSILETLRARRPLLVVVNERLQENHQVELARGLAKDDHLAWCVPATFLVSLQSVLNKGLDRFREYPPQDADAFANMLDKEMGFA